MKQIHGLKSKPGNHKINLDQKTKILSAVKEKYNDFKPTFASEKLLEDGLLVNPETLRLWMIKEQLWKVRKQKSPQYHAWRDRKEYFGEMQQFDGSYHHWFEGRLVDEEGVALEVCLLASIDDATGKITQAVFDFNEGVSPVFSFWEEYVKKVGKPLSIYLDKYSTYKINHKNAVDNTELLTQFQKALKILDIELITAHSPQAKGRVERLFGTLQDRLVKELRLNQINTITEGNEFLDQVFIPKFNQRFSVIAKKDGDVHKELNKLEKQSLNSIFSRKHLRVVNLDYTVQFKNSFYQLEQIQPVTIRPKQVIQVEEWLDETIHLVFKNKQLKYFLLPERPKKSLPQPTILTSHPLNWKPPPNHPWRLYKPKQVSSGGDISNLD